ncbi:MAG: VOC family protein [Gemmatimonadaceae bacterium]
MLEAAGLRERPSASVLLITPTTSNNTMTAEVISASSLDGSDLAASMTVKDLQTSLDWYQNVLGFAVDQKHERNGKLMAVSLRAGKVRMLLGQDDGAKGWERVKGEGISLQITTAQSIDDVATRIRAAGGTLETEPRDMPWGARMLALRDPDGFKLVVSGERK